MAERDWTAAWPLAQRKTLRLLMQAGDRLARGMEEVGSRQADLLRATGERLLAAWPELQRQRTLQGMATAQMSLARDTMEATAEDLGEIGEAFWSCNREASELLTRAALAGFEGLGEEAEGAADPSARPRA